MDNGGLDSDKWTAWQEQEHRKSINRALLPQKGRVSVQVAAQVSSQQPGLEMHQQAHRGFLAEEGMGDLFLLPFLPSRQDRLAGRLPKQHRPGFLGFEVTRIQLFPVQKIILLQQTPTIQIV